MFDAIERLAAGDPLRAALDAATERLREERGHEEVSAAVAAARAQASDASASSEGVQRLGEGWVAEEALAIAVYGVWPPASHRHGRRGPNRPADLVAADRQAWG